MASDENTAMIISSSTVADDEYDHDTDDGYDHQPHPHNLSRLSVCTSSMNTNEDDEDDYQDCDGMRMFLSRLSIESFDADEELSDDGKVDTGMLDLSSDSEPGCYSLSATPPRRRNVGVVVSKSSEIRGKDYASENDAEKGKLRKISRRRRRVVRERWMVDGEIEKSNKIKKEEDLSMGNLNYCNSLSGESEGSGLVVITRPKGGRRSLCMDLDEVKACRDLGFELEHERMVEMPNRASFETSSGGNSPIANWRISSPGDDPRDVKARLKVWAQAVAIASTSRHGGF
ncbi:uncharacterized protein [Euphorbia lathyris]|uniref:uncharacterized protein n=1 Tax=Euphorbia lathyris TaxID=212925 RepID=UPI003313ADCE